MLCTYRYLDCPYQGLTIRYLRPWGPPPVPSWPVETVQQLYKHIRTTTPWVEPVVEGPTGPYAGEAPPPAVTAFLRQYGPLPEEGLAWTKQAAYFAA